MSILMVHFMVQTVVHVKKGKMQMYKNSEGYVDPTAGAAMATVKREENSELNDRNHKLIHAIRNIVDLAGFEIVGRVTLKHKKSGKVFH